MSSDKHQTSTGSASNKHRTGQAPDRRQQRKRQKTKSDQKIQMRKNGNKKPPAHEPEALFNRTTVAVSKDQAL